MIAKVFINRKTEQLNKLYSYFVPSNLETIIKKGDIVKITFHNKESKGIVINLQENNDEDINIKLAEIIKIEKTSILNEAFFNTFDYIKNLSYLSENILLLSLIPQAVFSAKEIKRDENNNIKKLLNDPKISVLNTFDINLKIAYIKENLSKYEQVIVISSDYHLLDKYSELLTEFNPNMIHPYLTASKKSKALNNYLNSKGLYLLQKEILFIDNNFNKLIIIDNLNLGSEDYDQLSFSLIDLLKYKQKYLPMDLTYFGNPSLEFIYTYKDKISYLNEETHFSDIKLYSIKDGNNLYSIHNEILEEITNYLNKNEKVVIYNSRLNFSLYLYCKTCKKIIKCRECAKALKYTENKELVFCPSCHKQYNQIKTCPYCNGDKISYYGYGIEYTYSELKKLYPNKKILFINPNYQSIKKIPLQNFDILIGSKGINKFLNLDKTTHFILLNTDLDLALSQYNTLELTYQLITKFRAQSNYPVLIQSENDYSFFYNLLNKDYLTFTNFELTNRSELKLPPVVKNYQILYQSNLDSYLHSYKRIKNLASKLVDIDYIGPREVLLNNDYKYNFLITIKDNNLELNKIKSIIDYFPLGKEEGIRVYANPEVY